MTSENVAARLKEANSVTKTEFVNKLTSFNKWITSNKTKHLEVGKKLDSLITKDYSFLLGRIQFTSNDGLQNMFVYQPTSSTIKFRDTNTVSSSEYMLGIKGVYVTDLVPIKNDSLSKIFQRWNRNTI